MAVNKPETLPLRGGTPHTEAEREVALRNLNMQGDAGSVVFFDIRDPRLNECIGEQDMEILDSLGITTMACAHHNDLHIGFEEPPK